MGFEIRLIMIKKLLYTLFFIFSFSNILGQTNYYVAPSSSGGSNSNVGSISSPWETIAYAISQLSPSETLFIREGVYYEDILIDDLQGIEGGIISIEGYPNESITIDGTIEINNSDWQPLDNVSGAYYIYQAENITQLFVDEQQMVNARWPNAQFNDDSIFSWSTWAQGLEDSDPNDDIDDLSVQGSLVIDESVANPQGLDLANSIGILNIGSFKTETVKINNHTQNSSGNDIITYNHEIGSDDEGTYQTTYKDKHHHYFFEGKIDLLDTNNEWFNDPEEDILYLYPDDGQNPLGRIIKGKIRDYSMTILNSNYIKIKNINFFATTVKLENSDYITIEECNFYYPSSSSRMLGLNNGLGAPNVTAIGTGSGNSVDANNCVIKRCLFENAEGEALRIYGDNNLIENNYFHHIDFSVSDLANLMVTVNIVGASNIFTKNTLHTTGASSTFWCQNSPTFSYNKVSNTGLLQSDGAVFQGTQAAVENSQVHHNWIFDTTKYALRYDAPVNDAGSAGTNGSMHHNFIYNAKGIMVKGDYHHISHNTVFNTYSGNGIIILNEANSNTNTNVQNNLVEKMSAHRSASLDNPDNALPCGENGGIGIASNNINGYENNDFEINEMIDIYTGAPISGSSVIDAGILIDPNYVPHEIIGSYPDIGAYEFGGEVWTAGVDWEPKFHSTSWKINGISSDWFDPSNWSSASVPTKDVNVIIPAGAEYYPVISSELAEAKNITINNSASLIINSGNKLKVSGKLVNRGVITVNSNSELTIH